MTALIILPQGNREPIPEWAGWSIIAGLLVMAVFAAWAEYTTTRRPKRSRKEGK